jgi:amidase
MLQFPYAALVFWLALTTAAIPSFSAKNKGDTSGKHPYLNLSQTLENLYPYEFPVLENAIEGGKFPMPKCNGVKLEEATIDQLQVAMNDGRLTSSQLVLCYLQRIWQTDEYIEYV